MKVEKQYLESLTVGQLMVFLPDNNALYHDSGMWTIEVDHNPDSSAFHNSDLRNLLLGRISEYEFVDGMDIAVRKCDAEGLERIWK